MAGLRYAVYRAALEASFFSGAHRLARLVFGGMGTILTFHRVLPARPDAFQPNDILEVEPDFLDRLIMHLRRKGFDLIGMDDVWQRIMEGHTPRPFVSFTFDDAYRDNLEYAWPVLKRHGVPFTIYVATSFPDRLGELWWVALERVVAKSDRLVLDMNGKTEFIECADTSGKRTAFEQIYWWLRGMKREDELRAAVRDLCARYGVDAKAPCAELCMDWSEIATIAADPLCTIGAHTINHPILKKISAEAALKEIRRSADIIADALGEKPVHFAYPYGEPRSVGEREFALAAEAGYRTAVTTGPGVVLAQHKSTPTAIPRVSVNGRFQSLRYIDVLISGLPFAGRGPKYDAQAA